MPRSLAALNRAYGMAALLSERSSGRDVNVVFVDLSLDSPKKTDPSFDLAFMSWPRRVFDGAVDCRVLLNCETIDILQRNLNAGFGLLKRLAGAKNFGEVAELQAAYWGNQVAALIGQGEELAALSVKTTMEVVRSSYPQP
jgi:hypothetical protein